MNNQNSSTSAARGYTLLELLLAVSLLTLVALGALSFMSHARARLAEQAEIEELEERRSIIYDLIRHDFDDAGRLLIPPQRRGPSQEAAVLNLSGDFVTPPVDYQYLPGYCRKITSSKTAMAASDRGIYADGWLQFRPSEIGESVIGFADADKNIHALQFVPDPSTGGLNLHRYHKNAGGQPQINKLEEKQHLPGDRYRITLEKSGDSIIIIKYFRLRTGWDAQQIGSAQTFIAHHPYRAIIQLDKVGVEVSDMILGGASNATIGFSDLLLPAMLSTDKRLENAVSIDAPNGVFKSVTLIRSDPTMDAAYLLGNFEKRGFFPIRIQTPCRGVYKASDVLGLISENNSQKQTAIYRIEQVIRNGDCQTVPISELKLKPVDRLHAAWGNLYSHKEDLDGSSLAARSQIVRVEAPVTYRLEGEKLLRIKGGRKTVVARGVIDFLVTIQGVNTRVVSYEIKSRLKPEAVELIDDSLIEGLGTISYTALPRSLNRKYEHQAVGPAIP